MCDICGAAPCLPACPGARGDHCAVRCVLCGEAVHREDRETIGAAPIHRACVYDFCMRFSELYGRAFITYKACDFYLRWWFENLEKNERVRIAREAYFARLDTDTAWNELQEREFCAQHEDFCDFVRQKIEDIGGGTGNGAKQV